MPYRNYSIALISNDIVGTKMAGPGIRYWEFAHVLSEQFHVRLIIPPYVKIHSEPSFKDIPFELYICSSEIDFKRTVETNDIIITLGVIVFLYPFLAELDKPLVLDIYNPFLLEGLQRDVEADDLSRWTTFENDLGALRQQLLAGDFFVCASERQRDFWIGMLSAVGRINPHTHSQDPTFRDLIDVVPFGLPGDPPHHTHSVLKGVYPGIAADDQVILWAGGIWNWLDPLSVIRAMPLILQKSKKVKLFFMGVNRPNPSTPNLKVVEKAINLSKELDLLDRYVFFNDWVDYEDRQNFLLESDVGVSFHLDHIETHFSFRTRLLDHLWAGLPTIATRGGVIGEQMAEYGLAKLVDPEDISGIANAVLDFLEDSELRVKLQPKFIQLASRYRWSEIVHPLLKFCASPYRAPDKPYIKRSVVMHNKHNLLYKVHRAFRLGGLSGLLRQVREYLRFWYG